jgi:valyl-tRNA synthetase
MGQDLNLVTEKVLSSRNFANKLWNAGKFIILNLQDGQSPPDASEYSSADSLARLPLTERWVISALHQVCFLFCPPPCRSLMLFLGWEIDP